MKYLEVYDLLKDEYADTFQEVEGYGMINNIEADKFDDLMMNLADMLLTAQKNNTPVSKIIGNDTQKFCKEYFNEDNFSDKIKKILSDIFYWMRFLLIIELIDFFALDKGNILTAKSDIMGYILIAVISYAVIALMKVFFLIPRYKKTKKIRVFSLFFTILIGMLVLVISHLLINGILEFTPLIPSLAVMGITAAYVIIYTICILVLRYKKDKTFKNLEKIENKKLIRELKYHSFVRNTVKLFEETNKNNEKNCKEPVTKEKYMEDFITQTKKTTNINMITIIFMICLSFGLTLYEGFTNNFIEAGIFFLVLIAVQSPIYWIFFFSPNSIPKRQERVVRECKKRNMDIFEYNEYLSENSNE